MLGLMQTNALNLGTILDHAARWHGDQEIVTKTVEDGSIHRETYAEARIRARRFANALQGLGVKPGDRVGTMAWNTYRHVETWFALANLGAVCHTLNPRLFPDQIDFIVNDAEDSALILDTTFVPLIGPLLPRLPTLKHIVVLTDDAHMPDISGYEGEWHSFESLVANADGETGPMELPDANWASSLCYTSGTTGDPKGVMYGHASNIMHSLAAVQKDSMNLGSMDNVLMVVPMFHANSWGLTFALPMIGAKMVMPGPHMDGASILNLLNDEKISFSGAVPTVWTGLLAHVQATGGKFDTLKEVVIGGSAVPRSMIEIFDKDYGINVLHAWGMTEMSPLGTVNRKVGWRPEAESWDADIDRRVLQGRVPFGVDMKIVDDEGEELPHDDEAFGRLLVKGPWVLERYYGKPDVAVEADGYFDTGDIASITPAGFMRITDRAKDVIKSGGEWISSVDVENCAMGHACVALAACIGIAHPKWDERPLLLVTLADGATLDKEGVLDHLGQTFAKWQLPDDIQVIEEMPLTATGKVDKKPLRTKWGTHYTG
jgi:fatty-acyl-CoA synthase